MTLSRPIAVLVLATALVSVAAAGKAGATVIFSTDFSGAIPAEFSAPGAGIEDVQGYAGLGSPGRQFAGTFLRYASTSVFPTTLTLHHLPPHDQVSVKFLLGIIDSWDGTELMQVSVDGSMKFNHWFQLALGDTTDYFPAPPGAILSMGTDLGFNGCCYFNRDRAYDLGVEPALQNIPHTADSLVVAWTIGATSGPAAGQWQGGLDESWAIDAVSVEVASTTDAIPRGANGFVAAAAIPNPARGGIVKLQLSLADTRPVLVELFDLGGRLVSSRTLAFPASGRHEITIQGPPLTSGLYFARVSQGGQRALARILVLD